ncbi:hypothetical protein [Pseudactinotalea suaedae]|uniref:hypothetical protein n=1 Tax=Pseudactinotalea suaedae TaxID=1524924 RepID=UPI0012E25C63|nr:hypothetical protein [Pseudactinotalea suaedae]
MRTRRREVLTRWLLPLAAAALLAAVVALAGGFREARGDAGPAAEPGEQISLARWHVTVREVELVNTTAAGSPTDTALRVHLTVTLTGEESQFALPTGLVSVVVPGGPAPSAGFEAGDVWANQLDPDVARTYVLDHPWPAPGEDGEQEAVAAVPDTVAVVVRDETYDEGPLFGWEWGLGDVAAVVSVPVTDNRVEP